MSMVRRRRSGQWNRCLGYANWMPRPAPHLASCAAFGLCLLVLLARSSLPGSGALEVHSASIDAPLPPGRHLMASGQGGSENDTYYNYKCEQVASSTKGHLSWETCEFEIATGSRAPWIALYIVATLIIF
uniref:Sushi domain-containing protein n=1 Tax=Macrostomum lignano TaxID=282301 RepID=A0A1I8JM43_9PLAT